MKFNPATCPTFNLKTGLRKGRPGEAPRPIPGQSLDEMMAGFERELVSNVLEQNHFSLNKTAEQLKISRHALRYRMQRLNITLENEGDEESPAPMGKDGAQ